MQKQSLDQWLQHIEQLHNKEIDLGLSRITQVAKRLNCTRFEGQVITVAGTNGKGSCVHCLESIYLSAGYRVGCYTSPHLHYFNERIRIQGQNCDDAALIKAFECVEIARKHENLSFFEFTTLAALILFQRAALDVIILEVGLGGRLDAVNIVDPDIALITNIDLDHTDWLGSNRELIGYEKAGIFRHHRPVVCGDENPPQSLLQHAAECFAPYYQINKDFYYQAENSDFKSMKTMTWKWLSQKQTMTALPPIAIKHQNAAASLMVIELLSLLLPVSISAIKQGLQQVKVPGRFECWNWPVPCIFDVAHNPQAGRWLAKQLQALPCEGKRIAVVGMLKDKDIVETLIPFAELIDRWHVASLSVQRGALATHIIELLAAQDIKNCYNYANVPEAMAAALSEISFDALSELNHDFSSRDVHEKRLLQPNKLAYFENFPATGLRDQVVIFGSFYTVSAAQAYLCQLRGGH